MFHDISQSIQDKIEGIKKSFEDSVPSDKKVEECRKVWNEHHRQDRYIVVNHENELIDGYIQYLVLKENGIEEAEIEISERCNKKIDKKETHYSYIPEYRREITAYIYGTHINKKDEYIWRVPRSWKGWENNLVPGDKILVDTKYGIKPIVITRIEYSDKCPVDYPVRKVFKKIEKNLEKFDCSNIDKKKQKKYY